MNSQNEDYIDDCWSEYASYDDESILTYAFKLGARSAIETLTDKND